MPVATSNEFVETLRKSGLIEPAVLDEALASFTGTTEEPLKIAEYLVQRKLLTSFQAKSLLAGKYKGLVIGSYKMMEKIGAGGMGIVYLAEHDKLKRRVAIKILPEDKTRDKLALERFYREARAAAALDHPNIVKAFDINEHQGLHYLVMEYIDGTNLQKYVDTKGAMPWKTAVNIVIQACKGFQHA
ncbi:MAG TPA: serine/threonine-protein kinase, partial [Gemmatales bacterium]|nr:serine/threonine-protein kinase [Gemmatales bacterium]